MSATLTTSIIAATGIAILMMPPLLRRTALGASLDATSGGSGLILMLARVVATFMVVFGGVGLLLQVEDVWPILLALVSVLVVVALVVAVQGWNLLAKVKNVPDVACASVSAGEPSGSPPIGSGDG